MVESLFESAQAPVVTGAEIGRILRSVRMSVAVEVESQAEIAAALGVANDATRQ